MLGRKKPMLSIFFQQDFSQMAFFEKQKPIFTGR